MRDAIDVLRARSSLMIRVTKQLYEQGNICQGDRCYADAWRCLRACWEVRELRAFASLSTRRRDQWHDLQGLPYYDRMESALRAATQSPLGLRIIKFAIIKRFHRRTGGRYWQSQAVEWMRSWGFGREAVQ